MKVRPDTPIWSAAFRRSQESANVHRLEMERLVARGVVELIGPIRQELGVIESGGMPRFS